MRVRSSQDGGDVAPGTNSDPHFAELIIGAGTAYASSSNPTGEVISTTVNANVASGLTFGATVTLLTGLLTIVRKGLYLVYFSVGDLSSASASGVITAKVLVNGAEPTVRVRAKWLQPAVTNNDMSGGCFRILSLNKGDTVSVSLTGTVGGVISITDGCLGVIQLSDVPVTPTL